MSRFSGPQAGYKGAHGRTKGVMRAYREIKREEADDRARQYKQTRKNSPAETSGDQFSEAA